MTNAPFCVKRVAVVGASSQIGEALLPRLAAKGMDSFRIGRGSNVAGGDTVHVFNEKLGSFTPQLDRADAIISLAPLPSIELVLKMVKALGAKRIIAFGSTGRFSKVESTSAIEREFVAQQEHAERLFISQSEACGIAWTLFRPTMIYGAGVDQNVTFIKSMIHRFGFFPMPIGAQGLRQPVHVDDLAGACVSALECDRAFNRAYNLGGGETITFPEMVRRIFHLEKKRAILLPVPISLYYLLIMAAKRLPNVSFVRKEMVERMFKDLTVDNEQAIADFGFKPRGFNFEE